MDRQIDIKTRRPFKKNICALIVTYNPDDGLRDRVFRIARQVDSVVLVDNNSKEPIHGSLDEIEDAWKIHLILNDQNLGIAAALNQGVYWAKQKGYVWVLTLDQDTLVFDSIVETFGEVYENYPEKDKLALIGSNYYKLTSNTYEYECKRNHLWIERTIKTVITSGSLISLEAFSRIGPFREEFFIDRVDSEYCLRARKNGLKLILTCKPLMMHNIGDKREVRLPFKKLSTYIHSKERRYYITRNTLILAREYLLKEPIWVIAAISHLFFTFFIKKPQKESWISWVKFTLMGISDGLAHNLNNNRYVMDKIR